MKLTKTNIVRYINENLSSDSEPLLLKDIFHSDKSNTSGFQLTVIGKKHMCKLFDSYTISLTSKRKETTGNQALTLDRYTRAPYHISRTNVLTVFEEEIASQLLLMDGDLDAWVASKNYFN